MRRSRTVSALLLLLAAVLGPSGCASQGSEEPTASATIEVAGEVGVRPILTIPPGYTVTETTERTLIEGDGAELVEGAAILLDYVAVDLTTGETVKDTYGGLPEIRTLSIEDLGEPLHGLLAGARVGARLERIELGTAADPDPHLLVVDVRPTRATGSPLTVDPLLPVVTVAEDGTPSVQVPTTAPPTSVTTATLLKGTGPQVTAGQSVVIQLLAIRWADGAVVDSTWGVAPRAVALSDLGGLSAGLVEQTVGSQVLVVVPPADGNGVDTLVYVVDVLATGDASVPPAGTEGQPGSNG